MCFLVSVYVTVDHWWTTEYFVVHHWSTLDQTLGDCVTCFTNNLYK